MAEFASGGGALAQIATAFGGWLNQGGMDMSAGAGLAALGALAMAAANALRPPQQIRQAAPNRRAREKHAVRSHAEALSIAASDLLWRLKEITQDGSGYYVAPNAPGGDYYDYKRGSTAFRLAAVLGAMRLIDRETHVLGEARLGAPGEAFAAIQTFSATLADGPPQEYLRAARLCDVWGLPPFPAAKAEGQPFDPHGMHDAARFDEALRKYIPGVDVADTHALVGALMTFSREELLELFRDLAFDLAKFRGEEPPSPNKVLESVEETARALAFREARLFREWQRTIGDQMLDGERIRSFGEFEAHVADPAMRATPCLRRLLDLFEGVDVLADSKHDARPRQLRRLTEANASLILALAKTGPGKNALSPETIALAKTLAAPPA
jgi:hypothetical protein